MSVSAFHTKVASSASTPSSPMRSLSKSQWVDCITALALLSAAVAVPMLAESRYVLGQIILALFYAAIASQWNLLFGFAGILSLAQMAIFAVGGYVTAMLAFYFGWNVWWAIPAGALASVIFSVLVGLACLRLTGIYVALLTLAIAQTMYVLIITDTDCFMMIGTVCRQFTGGPAGFARFGDLGTRQLLGSSWLIGNYAIVLAIFVVTMTFTYIVVKSPIGLSFRALKDNPAYAVARGINRFHAQLLVFGVSAFFTGLLGGFHAGHFQAIGPGILALPQLLFIIAIAVVGGIGSFWGPLVGTIVLMLADELMRETGEFRTLGLGIIIAAATVAMPRGLVGRLRDLANWIEKRRDSKASTSLAKPSGPLLTEFERRQRSS